MSKDRHPLHPLIEDIQGKTGRIREDIEKIRGSLTKIRESLERGFEDIHDAVYDSIEAQAELKLMERLAEVQSIPPQIEAEQERIIKEREEIDEKLNGIFQRYERKHAELNQKATERVRDLGEHIFTILEDEFEDEIETPFVDALTPTWEELQEHNARVAADRNRKLRERFEQSNNRIETFLDHQENLLEDIDDHRVSVEGIDGPTTLQIPFWIVTIERNGDEETTIVGPSYLSEHDDRWFTVRIDPIEGFHAPFEQLATTKSDYTRPINTTPAELTATIDPYSPDQFGGSLNFATELRRAIPDEPEIYIERGSTDG